MKELDYDYIKNKDIIYIDNREKKSGRDKEFINYLKKYLCSQSQLQFLKNVCEFKRGERDRNGNKVLKSLNYEYVNLEVGDIAFKNCVIELKTFDDFNKTNGGGNMTTYANNLSISGFPHSAIILFLSDNRTFNKEYNILQSDYLHYWSDKAMWKGSINFGERTRFETVPSKEIGWEWICHYFKKWGEHENIPIPTTRMKTQNYALNALLSLNVFSDKQCKNIVNTYSLNKFPEIFNIKKEHLLSLGLNKNKVNKFMKIINGENLL